MIPTLRWKGSPHKLHDIFHSDEAWFSSLGYGNGNDNHVRSATNPHVGVEAPLHPLKIRRMILNIWVSQHWPNFFFFFFLKMITLVVYFEIIDQFFALLPVHQCYCFLQQDGSKAHIAHTTMVFFDSRLISVGLWLPRLPNFSKFDFFFLWGYLKDRVYSLEPLTPDSLKHKIFGKKFVKFLKRC